MRNLLSHTALKLLSLLLIFLTNSEAALQAQTVPPARGRNQTVTPGNPAGAPQTAAQANAEALTQEKQAVANQVLEAASMPIRNLGADYIPCRFTAAELAALTSPESVLLLTPADAEALMMKVIGALREQVAAGLITTNYEELVLKDVSYQALVGRTPSQALTRIVSALGKARKDEQKVAAPEVAKAQEQQVAKEEEAADKHKAVIDQTKLLANANSALADYNTRHTAAEKEKQDAMNDIKTAQDLIASYQSLLDSAAKAAVVAQKPAVAPPPPVPNPVGPTPPPPAPVPALAPSVVDLNVGMAAQTNNLTVAQARLAAANRDIVELEKMNPGLVAEAAGAKENLDQAKLDAAKADSTLAGSSPAMAAAHLVQAATDSINRLVRPDDVGCSMSVLSFGEMSKAYGRIIANTYVGVQVVVRNLNQSQEFTLHDVEFAVETDPAGEPGRFFAGRDKTIVRALAAAENTLDPRNLAVHIATAVGTLMSSATTVFGGALTDAAGVYVGAFVPSLDRIWKDMSVDQLNLLNDTGFSSSVRSQTVVPKGSTVMFVTFIPSKQFEQGWWAQSCATDVQMHTQTAQADVPADKPIVKALVSLREDDLTRKAEEKRSSEEEKQLINDTSRPPAPPIIEQALESCAIRQYGSPKRGTKPSMQPPDSQAGVVLQPKIVKFRNWKPMSLSLFEELSTVVVAGMHTVEASALKPQLDTISGCTDKDTGNVVIPQGAKDLSCTVTGANLSKVDVLRVRNSHDLSDPLIADGALSTAHGDDTTATVTFSADRLHALNGTDYSVSMVDPQGGVTNTALAMHFDDSPYVHSVTPPTLNLSVAPTAFTVSGYRLDRVRQIKLTGDGTDPPKVAVSATGQTATQLAVSMTAGDLAKVGTVAGTAKLSLILKDGTTEVATEITVPYTPK